jgi:putative hemolysin
MACDQPNHLSRSCWESAGEVTFFDAKREVEMYRKGLFILFIQICFMSSASCSSIKSTLTTEANLPNPASVYCEQNGGQLDLRQDSAGGVMGVCVFADGSECDEWAYFRGECQPGNMLVTPEPTSSPVVTESAPTAAEGFASDGCRIYRNEQLGYSFHYPVDAQIIANDDPLGSISFAGPEVAGERWPQYTISHPTDREDYRPPEDVDLEQWLIDHQLLVDTQQPDLQIAGTTAIHVRHDRSPQSYAFDRYMFAKSGQLYLIVIIHTGDREDWNLYNHFLNSIQFEN